MRLYVRWGTFPTPRPAGHPCSNAYNALRAAGHDPQVVKSYGLALLPDPLANRTSGREAARRLTGKSTVPVLELTGGTAMRTPSGSSRGRGRTPFEPQAESVFDF